MSAPCTNVCTPWAELADFDSCACADDIDDALLEENLALASDILFELSGHRFAGTCQTTVRPCGRQLINDGPVRYDDIDTAWWGYQSSWSSPCGCNEPRACGCNPPDEVTLGGWPVTSVSAVKVDGVVLDSSLYRIDDYRYLVRLPDADGSNPGWPCCQDVSLEDTEAGTWSVTYTYGQPPNRAARAAARVLGCELALSCIGSEACRLPRRVTNITRQGVTMAVLDSFRFLEEGNTGLYEVDLFLAAYGTRRNKRLPATVVNPDLHRAVRRAGT